MTRLVTVEHITASFKVWTWSAGQDAAPDEWFVFLCIAGLALYAVMTWWTQRKDS